jgi:antitoxin VapB
MAILIKDKEADALVRALAARTGESLTNAVKTAVRDRLKELPPSGDEIAARRRKLARILAEFDSMPAADLRTPNEIIGYNKDGLFD